MKKDLKPTGSVNKNAYGVSNNEVNNNYESIIKKSIIDSIIENLHEVTNNEEEYLLIQSMLDKAITVTASKI
jgi:hypothetical protein